MPVLGANYVESIRSLTTPVSTTSYTNSTGVTIYASVAYTLSPSVTVSADVKVEISPDGSTWTTWADPSLPIGASVTAGATGSIVFVAPPGYRYKVTATNATINSIVSVG